MSNHQARQDDMKKAFPSVSFLIPELRSGEILAWNELCDKFRVGMQGKSRLMIRASKVELRCTPEDLVQETFLKAWEQHGSFRGETTAQLAKWLLVILKNTFLDWSRQVKPEAMVPTWFDFSGQDETPSQTLLSIEREAMLHSCLATLEPKYQEVIVYRHFEGLKFAEIAQRLDTSLNIVAGTYRRGLEQLEKAMNKISDAS